MFTEHEQLNLMHEALRLLSAGHAEQAHVELCNLASQTPAESRCYPAIIGTANWIHPLENPQTARYQLAKALIKLEAK
jgi:hypothetical protein